MWTENFQMFKLDLEKAEEPNSQHLLDNWKSKKIPENMYSAKAFDCVGHNKLEYS